MCVNSRVSSSSEEGEERSSRYVFMGRIRGINRTQKGLGGRWRLEINISKFSHFREGGVNHNHTHKACPALSMKLHSCNAGIHGFLPSRLDLEAFQKLGS
eukprot:scaffold2201_cov143-Skeletonema_menzelii.AAC.15